MLLFAFHGATYLTLRTTGELCRRAARAAGRLSIAAAVVGAGVPDLDGRGRGRPERQGRLPAAPPGAARDRGAARRGRLRAARRAAAGRSSLTAAGAFLVVATIFTSLFPRVMVSSTNFSYSLTVDGASSAHYTLAVMSVVALIVAPVVLLYQAWTYRVFRARVGGDEPAEGRRRAGRAASPQPDPRL